LCVCVCVCVCVRVCVRARACVHVYVLSLFDMYGMLLQLFVMSLFMFRIAAGLVAARQLGDGTEMV
jgi:hypothetical protein